LRCAAFQQSPSRTRSASSPKRSNRSSSSSVVRSGRSRSPVSARRPSTFSNTTRRSRSRLICPTSNLGGFESSSRPMRCSSPEKKRRAGPMRMQPSTSSSAASDASPGSCGWTGPAMQAGRAPPSTTVSCASRFPRLPTGAVSRSRCRFGPRAVPPRTRMVRVLFIGDIVGRPGRDLVRRGLAPIVERHGIDFVIANVENAAAGFGVTREIGDQILDWGVDVRPSGNPVWDRKEALAYVGAEPRVLRPANSPAGVPGRGRYLARTRTGQPVGVVNLMGRVFMACIDDPFAVALQEIDALREQTRIVVVDFHAEATSEKIAMGWHLDGKVSAVIGTHTHVQTADERILPRGTAYLTDVGMTGPHDSIIGVEVEPALGRVLNALPPRVATATGNPRLHP